MTEQSLKKTELLKAIEMLTEVFSKKLKVEEPRNDEDILFYDNTTMMQKLMVSERTLQRYRKNGRIRSTIFGGKVYYPKNFMIRSVDEPEVPEGEKDNIVPLNEFIKRYNTPRPRSRIIDVDRLAKRLTYFPRGENKHSPKDLKKIISSIQAKRKQNHACLKLWPKKIKLIGLPIVKSNTAPLKF